MAKVIKKSQTSAGGIFLELIGFALLFLFPVGTVFGIVLIIAGASMAKKFVCSECGNKVEDKGVKLCPVCKTTFD